MIEKFIDYNTPTETLNLSKDSLLDTTKVNNGKTYSLLGLSTKRYFFIQRVLAGLWAAAETILTLGSRFSSDKTQSNWKIFFTGKTTIVVYKENPPLARDSNTLTKPVEKRSNEPKNSSERDSSIPPKQKQSTETAIPIKTSPPVISPIKKKTNTSDATNSSKASSASSVAKADPRRNPIKFKIAGETQEVKKITNILKNTKPTNGVMTVEVK